MKLIFGEFRDNSYKNKLISVDLTLQCKNEDEFLYAWEKIKNIEGVEWCGCPIIEEDGKSTEISLFL